MRLLPSGRTRSPETLAGEAAWVPAQHREGQVHLFRFRLQCRSYSPDAFESLSCALLTQPWECPVP